MLIMNHDSVSLLYAVVMDEPIKIEEYFLSINLLESFTIKYTGLSGSKMTLARYLLDITFASTINLLQSLSIQN